MLIPETSLLYCGIFALMYVALTANVGRWRGKEKRSLGHDHDPESSLFRAVRAHANFMEYVPFLGLLLVLDEMTGRSIMGVHFIGSSIVIARGLHAYGITANSKPNIFRLAGAAVTSLVMLALGVILIVKGIS